jgi:DNA-binding FadR family transcriptional regulator
VTSRVDQVVDTLGRMICGGDLAVGSRLTADEVQVRTKTSRSGVREALGILVSLGLVMPRRRIGYEVRPRADWNVLAPEVMRWRLDGEEGEAVTAELTALRLLVEPAAAAAAARRVDHEGGVAIAASAAALWQAAVSGDRDAFVAADTDLHRRILEQSGNDLFRALGSLLSESLPRRAATISLDEAHAHLDLADAIAQSDAERAERVAREIVAT